MPLTVEQKVDFIYRIALKMAEKEKWLTLSQLWMAEGELASEDIGKAAQALAPVIGKIRNEEAGRYQDIECALLDAGFTKQNIKWIIGVLYADYEDSFGQIIGKLADLPAELKMMVRKVKWS